MATLNKNFKVKNGLIVEGTTGTINNYDILTKKQDDQDYIVSLIGGTSTSLNTPNTVVKRDGSGNFAAGIITADLTGDVTGTVSTLSNHTTDNLTEGSTNKYFSDSLARGAFTGGTGLDYDSITGTFDIDNTVTTNSGMQTLTNKTISGADNTLSNIGNSSLTNHSISINGYSTDLGSSVTLNTDDVQEAIAPTNKWFTDARARDAVSDGDGLNYNSGTGVFSVHTGNGLEIGINGELQIDDTVVATESDLSTAISTHSDLTSGIHGVTGDVVGTTDTQTLTNKTVGDVLTFNDGSNNSTIDVDGNDLYINANDNLTLSTATGDVVLNPNGNAYIGSASAGNEIATNSYVDNAVSGLTWKQSVNVLAVANIPLTGSTPLSIDSHTLSNGYRVLLTAQSTNSENGIYDLAISGGSYTLTRSADADAYGELIGAAVFVMEGTTYNNTSWVQSNHYLTDFSSQSWTQFSGSGSVVAGTGITVDGLEVSIDRTTVDGWYDAAGDAAYEAGLVATDLSNHINDTSAHGITGDVVGTTDTQTLTDKTLGSDTALGANLDAANYKIVNLEDPTSNQDAATKFYVDDVTGDVAADLSTHTSASSGVHGVTGSVVGTTDSQSLTNKSIDGGSNTITNIANASLVNDSITINGTATALGSSITLDTDDISEGITNKYFTDSRAKDAAGYLLENATQTNIAITYDETNHTLSVVAENGVADSTTNNLVEGTDNSVNGGNNLYFTNARAVAALEAVVPNFTEIDINELATQIAATTGNISTASTVTAYQFSKDNYRSAKFLVKCAYGAHTEISEVLLTLDTSDNIAITEYATVGTNGATMTISADIDSTNVRLRVTTANNDSIVTVVGTLLV